jgi:signal transduction histidine kinase
MSGGYLPDDDRRLGDALSAYWRDWPKQIDATIAGALWLVDLITPVGRDYYGSAYTLPVYAALGYLPLVWRRRFPFAVFLLTLLHFAGAAVLMPPYAPSLPLAVGLFTVAARCGRWRAGLGLLAMSGPAAVTVLRAVQGSPSGERWHSFIVAGLVGGAISAGPFVLGRWAQWGHQQRQRVATYAATAAVADERGRIARDLHDIVAHAVTLMVLQAAGAARVLREQPARAEAALRHVDDLGQQATVELRRMLGLLAVERSGAAAPLLGLGDVGLLVDRARDADLQIELTVQGTPVALDPGVDLAGYRVVQEALTNAARYAARTEPVRLQLRWRPADVEIQVVNHYSPLRRGPAGRLSVGSGLLGMRERVRAAGGSLDTERLPDNRFLVRATLPATSATPLSPTARPRPGLPARVRPSAETGAVARGAR